MIILIDAENADLHKDLLEDMYRCRADVFDTRLGWDVQTYNGLEIDEFDKLDPTYVVSVCDQTGLFRGSARLLKTTGRNMLGNVFGAILDGQPKIADPNVLESSRFSVSMDMPRQSCLESTIQITTVELLLGLIEATQLAGCKQIVSVFDARMARLFRRLNCKPDPVGTPKRFGKAMAYAGLFDATDAQWRAIAANAQIEGSIIRDLPVGYQIPQSVAEPACLSA